MTSETSLVPETFRLATLGAHFGSNSDYAKVSLDLRGQSAWLVGASTHQSFGVGGTLMVDFASASQLYVGAQYYTQASAFPSPKLVLGGRLNLLDAGTLSLELQNYNRFYFSYQTRPWLERFVLESQIFQDGAEGQYQFMATVKMLN
jgi:hypothetical protein